MTLIQVKNKEALSLPVLFRIALKSIYDKKHLSFKEEKEMQESIVNWTNHLSLRLDLLKAQGFYEFQQGTIDCENQIALEIIGSLLYQDSKGDLDKRKEMFRKHNINYKKFHRLPDAYQPSDFAKAQEHLKEHMRTNPEDYS